MARKIITDQFGNKVEIDVPELEMSVKDYYDALGKINSDKNLSALAKSMMRRKLEIQTGYGR